jgi:hypothetical protein
MHRRHAFWIAIFSAAVSWLAFMWEATGTNDEKPLICLAFFVTFLVVALVVRERPYSRRSFDETVLDDWFR